MLGASASSDELPKPRCGGTFGLCGYLGPDGTVAILYIFEKAGPFKSDLAAVRIDGLWGFIDPSGAVVIEPRFKAVGDFESGFAEAAVDTGVGTIDRSGAFQIPPQFARAIPFAENMALVSERADQSTDWVPAGRLETHFLFRPLRMYHRDHGWVTSSQKFKWFRRPQDGPSTVIWASDTDRQSRFGLINSNGNWVVPPRFEHVQTLHDGLAVVAQNGKWGAVNESGEVAIPLEFDWLSFFQNGYAVVGAGRYDSRLNGLINSDGDIVTEPIYEKARRPETPDGFAKVLGEDGWYRVQNGTLVKEVQDGKEYASCPEGLQILQHGKRYLVTDAKGTPAFSEPVDLVSFGRANEDGAISIGALRSNELDCRAPIAVTFDNNDGAEKYAYVRPNGQALFNPEKRFALAHRFFMDYAVVQTDGAQDLWAIIDANGQFAIDPSPKRITTLHRVSRSSGRPVYQREIDGVLTVIDENGSLLPDVAAAIEDGNRERAISCLNGSSVTLKDGLFGLSDQNGQVLVPAVHRAISCFRNGIAWAPKQDIGMWCPIGPDGAFRDTPDCISVFYPVRVSHHFPEQFSEDPFESSVLWVRAGLRYGFGLRNTPPSWIADGVRSSLSFSVWPFSP